jgi:hypothetical protein
MKIVSALAILFITLAMTIVTSVPAQAATLEECQLSITNTQTALANVEIGGNNSAQTRASLESKLTGASTKLDEGKFEDALTKLIDVRMSVEKLASAPKPKISQEDANLLISDVNAAISCVQALIEGAG